MSMSRTDIFHSLFFDILFISKSIYVHTFVHMHLSVHVYNSYSTDGDEIMHESDIW